MLNSTIILSSEPRGIFLEGAAIVGTPYPGTVMQPQAATAPIGGEFTWQVYTPVATGDPRLIAVLIEDKLQGFAYNTAYTAGARCFLYVPISGEYINMLVTAEPGTGSANAHSVGDRLNVVTGTGLLSGAAVTSATLSPFMVMENITIPADSTGWVWCMRTQY